MDAVRKNKHIVGLSLGLDNQKIDGIQLSSISSSRSTSPSKPSTAEHEKTDMMKDNTKSSSMIDVMVLDMSSYPINVPAVDDSVEKQADRTTDI